MTLLPSSASHLLLAVLLSATLATTAAAGGTVTNVIITGGAASGSDNTSPPPVCLPSGGHTLVVNSICDNNVRSETKQVLLQRQQQQQQQQQHVLSELLDSTGDSVNMSSIMAPAEALGHRLLTTTAVPDEITHVQPWTWLATFPAWLLQRMMHGMQQVDKVTVDIVQASCHNLQTSALFEWQVEAQEQRQWQEQVSALADEATAKTAKAVAQTASMPAYNKAAATAGSANADDRQLVAIDVKCKSVQTAFVDIVQDRLNPTTYYTPTASVPLYSTSASASQQPQSSDNSDAADGPILDVADILVLHVVCDTTQELITEMLDGGRDTNNWDDSSTASANDNDDFDGDEVGPNDDESEMDTSSFGDSIALVKVRCSHNQLIRTIQVEQQRLDGNDWASHTAGADEGSAESDKSDNGWSSVDPISSSTDFTTVYALQVECINVQKLLAVEKQIRDV